MALSTAPRSQPSQRLRSLRWAPASLLALMLAACGGGGDSATDPAAGGTETAQGVKTGTTGATGTKKNGGSTTTTTPPKTTTTSTPVPPTTAEAIRLLNQATFGANQTGIDRVLALGTTGWVDDQLARPAVAAHLARWQSEDALIKAGDPRRSAGANAVVYSFYQQALQADDQLRQRVAFALSQIFVVSTVEIGADQAETIASFQDMLGRNAFGNFRTLLQDVAMHPAMGIYLSHLKNRKESVPLGRVPDQNFAREVMQLFTIGLQQLNLNGTPKLDAAGLPIDTYSMDDIVGMSSVFTGFSWSGPDTSNARFFSSGADDPQRLYQPMQGYSQFHSMLEKRFLGTTVPAQTVADPAASTKAAYDTLFNHPNVGPFIGRQLIQRLVTSNPSPGYVARVASVFNNNGLGTRGDLKAVVRAILLDSEARSASAAQVDSYGKLREPVIRLTNFLRAFNATSITGRYLIPLTDDPGLELGQTPMRSPSVFNFYRPGYVPAGGEAAARGLMLPEMQITDEASVAGYANFMAQVVDKGIGTMQTAGRDVQPNYTAELALATDPVALVDRVVLRLIGDGVSQAFKDEVVAAVNSMPIPALNKSGTNTSAIERAKRNRVLIAVQLCLVSPEFIVQK